MKSRIRLCAAWVVTALAAGWGGIAQAGLIDDSVEGELVAFPGIFVVTPFSSPVVVAASSEFNGEFDDNAPDQEWEIDVDIGDSGFTVGVTSNLDIGNLHNPSGGIIGINLTDLNWVGTPGVITDVVNTGYQCALGSTGDFLPCNSFGGGPSILELSFGADSVSLVFNTIRHSELYTFSIEAEHIPAPATLTLMSLALVGIGYKTRKRITAV